MAMSGFGGGYQPGSIANIFQGLFGDPGRGYKDASRSLEQMLPQAQSYNMPFLQAGQQALPGFSQWLQGMSNPSGFMNNLMGGYQESPYAHYQQQQGMRAAQNMGSTGMSPYGGAGSTPLMQFAQQNAQDISSKDMNSWLQNVLGINSLYGSGMNSLISGGRESANSMQKLMSDYMGAQAGLSYGQGAANQGKMGSLVSGITGLFGL